MTEPEPAQEQIAPDIIFGGEPRRAGYVDFFRIAFNPITFTFEFFQIALINSPNDSPKCYFVGAICMSPQETKLLSENIKTALENYETNNGEIKIVQGKT